MLLVSPLCAWRASFAQGDVVPTPTLLPKIAAPLKPLNESAATVEVAEPVLVAKYMEFAVTRMVHARLPFTPSEIANCGRGEDVAIVSAHRGVVVPIPTPVPPIKVADGPELLCVTASVGKAEDEEAKSPLRNHIGVEVDCVVVPYVEASMVKGHDPPPPLASFPSQRSELPVIVEQKALQVEAVTPPNVRRPVTSRLVLVAFTSLVVVAKRAVVVACVVEAFPALNEEGKITWLGNESVHVRSAERS